MLVITSSSGTFWGHLNGFQMEFGAIDPPLRPSVTRPAPGGAASVLLTPSAPVIKNNVAVFHPSVVGMELILTARAAEPVRGAFSDLRKDPSGRCRSKRSAVSHRGAR